MTARRRKPTPPADRRKPAELARRMLRADRHLAGLEEHLEVLGLLAERSAVATARDYLAGTVAR